MTAASGVLYVVATPIGNLEDLTIRARRMLSEVRLIAAEDTRRTAKLLAHYGIRTPMVSIREHNEAREAQKLISRLAAGEDVALVTDAGTPGIADPGARLVRAARAAGISVIAVPGPSAVTAALSVSGLLDPHFVFMGFPPAAGSARRSWFEQAGREHRPVVFFEAPHRLARTLRDGSEYFAERPIHIYGEISKIHEKYIKWPNERVSATPALVQGEFVLVMEPVSHTKHAPDRATVAEFIGQLTAGYSFSPDQAVAIASSFFKISRGEASKIYKKSKILAKQQSQSTA